MTVNFAYISGVILTITLSSANAINDAIVLTKIIQQIQKG